MICKSHEDWAATRRLSLTLGREPLKAVGRPLTRPVSLEPPKGRMVCGRGSIVRASDRPEPLAVVGR